MAEVHDRKAAREAASLDAQEDLLPQEFQKRLREWYPSQMEELLATFTQRPLSFRVNPTISVDDAVKQLTERGFQIRPVKWLARYFTVQDGERALFTRDPLVVAGQIYIQSLASAAVGAVLAAEPGQRVLDLAAAPGSKTSQIAIAMQGQGQLVANDSSRSRFFRMLKNLELQGLYRKGDPFWRLEMQDGVALARRLSGSFDKVLLDAPCGGESRFVRGDSESLGFWNRKKVKLNADRQRRLIVAAFGALRVGGELVYSTCTISPEENEFVVQHLLNKSKESAQLVEIDIPGIDSLPPPADLPTDKISPAVALQSRRIYPNSQLESFFMAKIRRVN